MEIDDDGIAYGKGSFNYNVEECVNGHDISEGSPNVRIDSRGKRVCLPCKRERAREYRARKKQERSQG